MTRLAVLSAVLLTLVATGEARGDDRLRVDIRGSAGRNYQVAVQRFQPLEGAAELRDAFHDQLQDALGFSGLLDPVSHDAFLDSRETLDFDDDRIACENWKGIGADALVQGRLELDGDRLVARVRIWDTLRCRTQGRDLRKRGVPDQARFLARSLADDIVERFTGKRGVSSTQIAFVSDERGNKEVWVMDADGESARRVTGNGSINLFPSWSPDSRSLLYTSFRGGAADLWMVFRGPQQGRRVLDEPHDKFRGVFAPDNGTLALVMNRDGNTDLFTVNHDGSKLRRLTTSRAIETSPSWSPDGRRIAFVSDRSGSPQIYVKDLKTKEERRLTFRGSYNASPAWSPTGEWIAYAAQTGTNFDLYLLDPDTAFTTPLVLHPRSDEDPSWSPDGRKIVFTSTRRGRPQLYRIDVDGRNLTHLSKGAAGNHSNPAWSGWLE